RHLRVRDGRDQPTTAVELFFDLVYVFAVTQLSHLVIDDDLSLISIARAGFLLLVVWWAWIYTTWLVNWFDPGSGPVRLVLVGVGLASLLMSAAIPHAFGDDALLFASAYVALQVGRNLAAVILLEPDHTLRPTFERISAWSIASGTLWLAGGLAPATARFPLWALALGVDLLAPFAGYWTPGWGRSQTADWPVEGGHFAERFQGFIIIALGESIVVTGATASAKGLSAEIVVALTVAFLGTGALWWLYFGEVAEHSRRQLAESEDPGRLARDAYTYLHLPIVAGIIMVAVADDLLIAHPGGTLSAAGRVMTVGGPAVYLLGETLFRLRMIGSVSPKRVATVLALAVIGVFGGRLPALAMAGAVTAVLTLLCLAEYEPLVARLRGRERAEALSESGR
ncbi:MAG: low temperature requirement protein A, partial [Solirubrobacteraceae bacterium]